MSTEPFGYIMQVSTVQMKYGPEFQMIRMDTQPRENARAIALKQLREVLSGDAILFLREDGQHEAWTRSELEAWAQPNPTHPTPTPSAEAMQTPTYIPTDADADVIFLASGKGDEKERRAALAAMMARDRTARRVWIDRCKELQSALTRAREDSARLEKALTHYAHADFLTTEQQSTAEIALTKCNTSASNTSMSGSPAATNGSGLNPDAAITSSAKEGAK